MSCRWFEHFSLNSSAFSRSDVVLFLSCTEEYFDSPEDGFPFYQSHLQATGLVVRDGFVGACCLSWIIPKFSLKSLELNKRARDC